IDAARGSTWTTLTPAPSGVVLLTGTIDGDRQAPALSAVVATEALAWSTVGPVAIDARVSLAESVVTIEALRVDTAGGEVAGDGRVRIDREGDSTLDARWRNLDLSRLLTAVPSLTLRPGA